ncbi:MAG: protoheme IX farnesyltransferase [Gammaproteobacteria bacterium]|nr:protoheme IX farnesyltransferase [Gammaproteobacteria bacterium]
MRTTHYQLVDPAIGKSSLAYYIQLTKPGIVGLCVVAALTGMFFANKGMLPQLDIIVWTSITLAMAVAGSCVLNNYYDRDIDKLMERTRSRPLVALSVEPIHALYLSLVLIFSSVALMSVFVNLQATLLTIGAIFGYAVVYTMLAKRRTHWANQLGGIAGAMPPLIGYVAVKGGVDINALTLFAIMVVWQQPHALSLALKYRRQYACAGVPVVPVIKGVQATKVRIAIYSAVLLLVALLPYFLGMAGMIYLVTSVVISSAFLVLALRFLVSDRVYDMRLFFYSIVYLVVLFTSMVFDAL